ncbi:MAG: hypothetical protein JST59_17915 [Actinobacteria bacterium]|nr:hypothetical protein [Actinomycetota bacterium]
MERRPRATSRLFLGLGLLAAVAAAVLVLNLTAADSRKSAGSGRPQAMTPVADHFAELAGAQTNRCNLAATELRQMPMGARLQGSCCFPMDRARYRQQLRGLRAYRQTGLVPSDPYDVSVRLAQRLLGYRKIALDWREAAIYTRATKLSSLGGPCCCPCWRWQAFKGQARFLIARRHFSAAEIAKHWGLEEGCGGPAKA